MEELQQSTIYSLLISFDRVGRKKKAVKNYLRLSFFILLYLTFFEEIDILVYWWSK